jgi:hypothetical protein
MVLDERDRILAEAIAAGCSPDGHRGIGRAAQMDGRLLGFIHTEVKATPERTVALMRSEVVTLVQAHAEDAVKRHVERMLPAGQAAVVSRESAPGWLASVGTTLRTVGIPGAVVSVSAVVALALWIVLEVVKR